MNDRLQSAGFRQFLRRKQGLAKEGAGLRQTDKRSWQDFAWQSNIKSRAEGKRAARPSMSS
jgi:hypothetical protein